MTDPQKDNSVKPEVQQEVQPDTQAKIQELEAKIADQSRHLTGSKSEALKIRQENEALRAQIENLKTQQESPQVSNEDLQYVDQILSKAGYVKKDDLKKFEIAQYQKERDSVLMDFMEKYPEYKPENDKGDIKWTALINEVAQYKEPDNPKDWFSLLKKAHKIINPDNSLEKGKSLGMAEANLGELSKIGGSSGVSSSKAKRSPAQQAIMDELYQKRPHYKT